MTHFVRIALAALLRESRAKQGEGASEFACSGGGGDRIGGSGHDEEWCDEEYA